MTAPGTLIAIDPGLNFTGWSAWRTNQPVACGVVKNRMPKSPGSYALSTRIVDLRNQLINALAPYTPIGCVAMERMNAQGERGTPQDLMDVSLLAGVLASYFSPCIEFYTVNDWKGDLSNKVLWERVKDGDGWLAPHFVAQLSALAWTQGRQDALCALHIGRHFCKRKGI